MSILNARRLFLWVALTAALPPAALAQPSASTSHRLLDDQLPSYDFAEQAMAERLRQLKDFRELQDIAQKLLKDQGLREKLEKSLKSGELSELERKLSLGDGLQNDPALKALLNQAASGFKPEETTRLKELAQRLGVTSPRKAEPAGGPSSPSSQTQTPQTSGQPGGHGKSGPPPMPHQRPPAKPISPWSQLEEKSRSWFQDRMADFPDRLADFLNEMGDANGGDALRRALRSLGQENDGLPFNLADHARNLAQTFSGLKGFLPAEGPSLSDFQSLLEDVHLPSAPRIRAPSVSIDLSEAGSGTGPLWLWVAVLATMGFVLYKTSGVRRLGSTAKGWRLGPWPVAPGAVATRGDLVAAFEYLALLNLGPAARACHHLALAASLGELGPEVSPERCRAAGELARLYEQARYTPGDEPLSPDDLAAARRDLCLLAGVAAA
jgi:hypothetical protein